MSTKPQNYKFWFVNERINPEDTIYESLIGGATLESARDAAIEEYNREHPNQQLELCRSGNGNFRLEMQGDDGKVHQFFLKKKR